MSPLTDNPRTWVVTGANIQDLADELGVEVLGSPSADHAALLHAGGHGVHAYLGDTVIRHADGTTTVRSSTTGRRQTDDTEPEEPTKNTQERRQEYALSFHFTIQDGTPLEVVTALSDAMSAHLPVSAHASYMALTPLNPTPDDDVEPQAPATGVGQRLQVHAGSTTLDGYVTELLPAKDRTPTRISIEDQRMVGLWSTGEGPYPLGWVMTSTGAILTGTAEEMETVSAPGTHPRPFPAPAVMGNLRYNPMSMVKAAIFGTRPAPTNLIIT
ncbi:hypothetical protein BJF83_20940 [Nocardiopsis sp. CNR-923]|uniref:hypothetical protein n=1 Tax=Nocardiopsis sp. CNR-923 TaxID=1904965 RepID=UPI00096288FF|nr:hypothetical protein [Nocardiopsis sp. CNR-923]OLT26554.1 hypothetical protein BJF83_20940 [Nocardiopsis sp. CNR-923]